MHFHAEGTARMNLAVDYHCIIIMKQILKYLCCQFTLFYFKYLSCNTIFSVDDFTQMLKSTVLLELPQGFEEAYPEIWKVINVLEHTEFKTLSLENEIVSL